MRIDWGMLLTIFLAIALAEIFRDVLKGGSNSSSTQVGAKIQSPASPVIVYSNPIDQYLAEKYPNAKR